MRDLMHLLEVILACFYFILFLKLLLIQGYKEGLHIECCPKFEYKLLLFRADISPYLSTVL